MIETARDQRGLPWLDSLARDLRLACRSLRRSPMFTSTATISLAVGVAANTIGFGFLYGYLIRPLPFATDRASSASWPPRRPGARTDGA